MKAMILALSIAVLGAAALAPTDADARRLGGGGASGMQRSLPSRAPAAQPPATTAPAAKPATPATAANPAPAAATTTAAAAAAAPKRSWLGPIAGIAAGLGIAALMSHLGLGAAFGEFLTLALIAIVAVVAIRFLMRRFAGGPRLATPQGAAFERSASDAGERRMPMAVAPTAALAAAPALASASPADFDAAGFERIAKMIFIRLQAANDSADLNDLRAFTTPEMYAAIKLELQERGSVAQRTDVVRVDAEVIDVASEADRQIVSVRFHGLIREELDGVAAPFDEIWHLVRPSDGSRDWAIAGIQQSAALAA